MSVLGGLARDARDARIVSRAASVGATEEVLAALSARRLRGRYSSAGAHNPSKALQHIAVWASVNFIADLISTLPWHTYTHQNGVSSRLPEDPPLIERPDLEFDNAVPWRRQALVSALLRGNTYGLKMEVDRLGFPLRVTITNPDDWKLSRKGKLDRLVYYFDNNEVDPDQVWRMTAYEMPGSPVGLSPLTYVAHAIGLGLAASQFGSDCFEEGGTPTGLLTNDNKLEDGDIAEAKKRWKAAGNDREIRALGKGWKYQQIQVAANESQFLETIQANGALIATFFGLRPEDIGHKSGDSMTYANIEQRNISRLVYPLSGWIQRLERSLTAQLPRGQYVKANVDAILRVDAKTRTDIADKRIRMGASSINEVRGLDDLPPIPDGDQYLWPPYRAFPIESDQENP